MSRSANQHYLRRPGWLLLFFFTAARLLAAPTGPTLQLDYGRGHGQTSPVSDFMYFVPLISRDPVLAIINPENTQRVKVSSSRCKISGGTFQATCEFEFTGEGRQENILDHTDLIRRHEHLLETGGSLTRQLSAINVEGAGSGSVEIEGAVTNGIRQVNTVRLHFNGHGKPTPVFIKLEDLTGTNGNIHVSNELIARVNTLTFRRTTGRPKMEVTLASVKAKDAADNAWQDFMGGVKGIVANQFLPPIVIEAAGHQAMLDFGAALVAEKPTFTFPFAARLKTAPAGKL